MTIVLDAETQRLLEQKLKSGKYDSANDVVRAALDALDQIEAVSLDEETLKAIDRAEDQFERGEGLDWREVRDQVRAKFMGK